MNQPRFLLNKIRKLYHDTHYSHEQCNIDDQKNLEESHLVPFGYRLCKHCERQQLKEQTI